MVVILMNSPAERMRKYSFSLVLIEMVAPALESASVRDGVLSPMKVRPRVVVGNSWCSR